MQSKVRVIILSTNDPVVNNNTLDITEIKDLAHLSQAIMLANNFQAALVPTSSEFGQDVLRFDVNQGISIANNIYPKAVDINYISRTLSQSNNQVNSMINMVVNELKLLLGINLADSVLQQLTSLVAYTFTNLYTQQNSAWVFWGKQASNQTNYTYNIVFAIQNAQTGNFMKAIPMGFEISAYAVKEQVLFFTIQDYASYSVKIQAINVTQPLINSSYGSLSGVYNIITALNNISVITMSNSDENVNLWYDNDDLNQKWILEFNHNHYAYIIRNLSNRSLVLTWDSTSGSNNVFATNYQGNDEQFWIIQDTDNDYFYLSNMRDTQYVLEIAGSVFYNGTNVIVNKKTSSLNQKFSINRINRQIQNGIYNITTYLNASSVITMSTDYNINVHDYPVNLWFKNDSINQKWIFEFDSDKSAYRVRSVSNPSLFLSWPVASFTNRAAVTPNPRDNEYFWFLQSAGLGTFYLVSMRDTRYVLEVENSNIDNGTNIIVNQRTGNFNQRFYIENIN